VGEKRIFSL